MSAWAARRFWTEARAIAVEGGFTVQLDAKLLLTPLQRPLILPTQALAEAVAVEWQAQEGKVDPMTMPVTCTANSAIDKVAPQFAEMAAMLAAYGETDLLCYRATEPQELIDRQSKAWDPLLDWAEKDLGAPLLATAGIMHIDQPPASLVALRKAVGLLSPFQLAAFHDLVAISGSLIIGFAVIRNQLAAEEAWELSRIDESWQISDWGEDDEAAKTAVLKRVAFVQADRFYVLCG